MKDQKLNVKISPFGFMDLLVFKKLIPTRKKKIASASAAAATETPPVNALARRLHPEIQCLEVAGVSENGPARTYRLIPDGTSDTKELALFRPGQYLSFSFEIDGASATRPYSISSSPAQALEGFYEITVKQNDGGFVSGYIWEHWQVGTKIRCSGPQGQFTYDALRDSHQLVGIAGGCGITPFCSMAKSILDGSLDAELTIFYGSNTMDETIFHKELKQLEEASGGRVRVIHVLANEDAADCERGFITAELIKKHVDPAKSSFFICGPQAMYGFVDKELSAFGLPQKSIRRELFGEIRDVCDAEAYPRAAAGKSFSLTVHMGGSAQVVPALSEESLLVAMERAGMRPPSVCRSGVCGYCRSALIRGEVFIPESEDGRRQADRNLGFIHPCSTYPLSDIEIIVPRDKPKHR